MTIYDLLTGHDRVYGLSSVEADALTEPGALMEAALLDAKMDTTTAELWLLFDCRGALQIQEGNTAVVVVHNVTEFSWTTSDRGNRTWRAVMSWEPAHDSKGFKITADFELSGRLEVVGTGGEFYVGNIPGGDAPPPDFTHATDEQVREGLASWSAEFEVIATSRW